MQRYHFCEIDLAAIRHNVGVMKSHIAGGARFLAVVKADAYGHGAAPVAKAALEAGADMLAVAIPEEGIELREAGIAAPILVLGGIEESAAEAVVQNDLTQVVFDERRIRALAQAGQKLGRCAEVHLKLDTGMNRIGVRTAEEAQALTRDVVSAPFRLRTYRLIRKILIGFILVSIANVLFSYFFYTPKMYRIIRDNRDLVIKYRILQDRIRTSQRRVDEIRHRDNYVYRSLFSTDTVSIDGVWQPYPDTKYAPMAGDDFAPLMVGTWKQLDALARILYLESVSFDELQAFARDKEKMSSAIPAIWPIDRSALHNDHIGAFNLRRMHPVLGYIRPHKGIDLGCDRGTPVYATGDAVVEVASSGGNGGYGHMVLLNHEFGYKTRYAHLSKVLVQPGERVARGQVIAETGNTGISSGPHLHYEVIHKGMPVNPINYFNRNMTAAEYDALMENMRDTNFEKL